MSKQPFAQDQVCLLASGHNSRRETLTIWGHWALTPDHVPPSSLGSAMFLPLTGIICFFLCLLTLLLLVPPPPSPPSLPSDEDEGLPGSIPLIGGQQKSIELNCKVAALHRSSQSKAMVGKKELDLLSGKVEPVQNNCIFHPSGRVHTAETGPPREVMRLPTQSLEVSK